MDYLYLGDRLTDPSWKNQACRAVRRADGKCIRSPMGTMLVEFANGKKCIVIGRRLRKIK